jgi:hypothetical protein
MSLDLDPIKAREAAATPRAVGGVWCHRCMSLAALSLGSPERVGTVNFSGFAEVQHAANRTFIAHARTDVPALLAEVRRLRAQLAECPVDHPEPEPPVDCLCGDPDCWDGLA